MRGLISVGFFLFSLFFNVIIFILWARIILRYFRISSLHPISRVIYALTNPVINPIEKLVGLKKIGLSRYDWASFGILILVELVKFTLISLLFLTALMPVGYIVLYALADLIVQPCNLLFYLIIIRVIMSWIQPGWRHPAAEVLYVTTEPALNLGRRILPDISGFDFSPFIILIILKVVTLFIESLLPLPLL